jgi:hypothetical protein
LKSYKKQKGNLSNSFPNMHFSTILLTSCVFAAPTGFSFSSAERMLTTGWKKAGTFGKNLIPTTRGGKILTYGGIAAASGVGAAFELKKMMGGPTVIGPDPNDPANKADLERMAAQSAALPEDIGAADGQSGVPTDGQGMQDATGANPNDQVQKNVAPPPQTLLRGPGTNFASLI